MVAPGAGACQRKSGEARAEKLALYTRVMANAQEKPGPFGKATREIEAEVKKVLEMVEERVVPRARRDGEKVLRRISQELSRWADHLHDQPGAGPDKPTENKQ